MNKSESKYFHTAHCMDEALISLLKEKDLEYITVKEICQKAGVNRSTFYLHYESIADLVGEAVEMVHRRFSACFAERKGIVEEIDHTDLSNLILIKRDYLYPYLRFVREHKDLYWAAFRNPTEVQADLKFGYIKKYIVEPILRRFGVPEACWKYYIAYSIEGTAAIVREWLSADCSDSLEMIAGVIEECIRPTEWIRENAMEKQTKHQRLEQFREKWNNDYSFKTFVGSWASLCLTVIFALYHGYLGIALSSIWYGSICVYYLLLVSVRGMVLHTEYWARAKDTDTQRLWRKKAYFISSTTLLGLNFTLIVPIPLMVLMQKPVSVGRTSAIAMATYTTCKITLAIINMRRSRAYPPLIHELRTINLIDAFVSILTLQNTLIMVNSDAGEENSMITLSAITSALIYLAIIIIAIRFFFKRKERPTGC